jgi:hypothetical protein
VAAEHEYAANRGTLETVSSSCICSIPVSRVMSSPNSLAATVTIVNAVASTATARNLVRSPFLHACQYERIAVDLTGGESAGAYDVRGSGAPI